MNRLPDFTRLKRFLAAAPLFPPLAAVVGILFGGWGWSLALLACTAAALGRQWKILLLIPAAATYAGLKNHMEQENILTFRQAWETAPYTERTVSGTVLRSSEHSALLAQDGNLPSIDLVLPEHLSMLPGEAWRVRGLPAAIPQPLLPGMFDRGLWLARMGAAGRMAVIDGERLPPHTWTQNLLIFSRECRSSLAGILKYGSSFDAPSTQLITALLLGDKEHAEETVLDTFRRSGCIHAFAVSGLHVGIIALLLGWLLKLCRCSPRLQYILLLLLLGCYIFVTGMPVSAIRAYLMVAAWLLSRLLRRDYRLLNIWSFAALAILLWNPRELHQPGFQLSFAVYASLCLGASWSSRYRGWWQPDDYIPFRLMTSAERLRQRTGRTLCSLVTVSICAWLVSLPICAAHFHAISTWGVLSNIALTPLLPLVMGLGIAAICLSWCPPLLSLINQANRTIADIVLQLVAALSGLPAAYVPTTPPMPRHTTAIFTFTHGGHACLLGNPGLLIDSGTEKDAQWILMPALFQLNAQPCLSLGTHPHRQQTEGLPLVLNTYPDMQTIDSATLPAGGTTFRTKAGSYTVIPPHREMRTSNADDTSPIVLWEHGNRRTLYVGDASFRTLLRLPDSIIRADTVILGKHTRHPAHDLEWLQKTGATRILSTDQPPDTAPKPGFHQQPDIQLLPPKNILLLGSDPPN